MSLIKKLIQRLLDSRTTPNEAAHSAMPSYDDNAVIEITPIKTTTDGWEKAASFVATSDGYVLVQGTARNDNVCQLSVDNSKNIRTVIELLRANSTTYFVTPATKGSTVQVFGHYMTNITIKLTKAIGGGYNYFVRRALSCLKPSFNFSPKVSSKAKNLGFQNNQLLLSIRALIFLAQAPRISLPTPHRATAGRLLGAIQLQSQLLKSKSRTGRWHLLPYLTETLRELESVVTLKKGHRLSSCAVAEVQPIILFGSTKQVQTFDPLTGGALC